MNDETIFYFAYGSNADPDRFRDRVGPWRTRERAWLTSYRLRFADSVRSEGGGGAVVDAHPGGRVDGVLFEITPDQLAAMDREEFAPSRDARGRGRRIRCGVNTDDRPLEAELYTVDDDGAWCRPSERYLGFILRGLEDAGHSEATLERVRRAASSTGDTSD